MVPDKRERAVRLVRVAIYAVAREAFGSRVVNHSIPGLSAVARNPTRLRRGTVQLQ
jgi:hypothetical protein